MLTIRLKPSVEQRLENLALRTGRTKTFYAARAIEDRLAEFERACAPVNDRTEVRDPVKIRSAIRLLKSLRQGVQKPEGLTVREMREDGRA